MYDIGKRYKNIKRYREIWKILKKYGFSMISEKMEVGYPFSKFLFKRSNELTNKYTRAQRIRLAIEELGPSFIKFGQILSTRYDILPADIVDELSLLQDRINPFSFEVFQDIFKKELNREIYDVFSYFDKVPIATASIGQVYQGKLKNGEWVVVKIQRPNIKKTIENDMDILYGIGGLIDDYFNKNTSVRFVSLIKEFSYYILRELDYTYEAQNCMKFREIYKGDNNIIIPNVYWEYTTKKVLIMEKIEGIKLSDIDILHKKNIDKERLARNGAKIFMDQIFKYQIFHGDPHPGNIMVLDSDKISYIDFGIVGYIDKITKNFIITVLRAGINKDIEKIIDSLYNIDAISGDIDEIELRKDIYYILSHYYNVPMNKLKISDALNEVLKIVYRHNIKIPSQLTLLTKSIITVEGISKKLDPKFNISSLSKEVLKDISKDKLNVKDNLLDMIDFTIDNLQGLKTTPKTFLRILDNIEKNRFKITVSHAGLEGLKKEINTMTNKISLSLMVSALIVGSSIAIYINSDSKGLSISLIGLIGYLIGAILGIGLVISILFNIKNYNGK